MIYDERADFDEKRKYISDLITYLEGVPDQERWLALEIGCGGGVLGGLLAHRFSKIISTDVVSPNLAYGGQLGVFLSDKFARNDEAFPIDRIEFLSADAQRLPFRDNYFDFCFSQNAFEHIPDPEMALRELARVIRPGGFIYLQFDPVWTADSGSHFQANIGEPWLHLLADDELLAERMKASGANEEEIHSFRSHMNRRPISYYREMFPRVIDQLGLEIMIHHEWAGTVEPEWTEHPNLKAAAEKLLVPEEDLLVRGMRYLLKVTSY